MIDSRKEIDTNYLETTWPSDYDTFNNWWYCTIGQFGLECLVRAMISYLQDNGDEWYPIHVEELKSFDPTTILDLPDPDQTHVEIKEEWLAAVQRMRVPRPGPAELIRSSNAQYGLQLRYPNGQIKAAVWEFSAEQCVELEKSLPPRKIDLPDYCCPFGARYFGGDATCDHDYPPEWKNEQDKYVTWKCSRCGQKVRFEVYQ